MGVGGGWEEELRIVWVRAKLDLRRARSWGQNRDREGFVVVGGPADSSTSAPTEWTI